MDKIITLYIATHNVTNKKYFGKTIRWITLDEYRDVHYHGSGTYWKNHLLKHGNDVSIEIYGIFSSNKNDNNYVEPIALKFSEDNNIVESKEWANLRPENGLDGGSNGIDGQTLKEFYGEEKAKEIKIKQSLYAKNRSKEHNAKISETLSGRTLTDEHKKNIGIGSSLALKGRTHEDIYGEEQSKILKENLRNKKLNKTYEEILGYDLAKQTKNKKSETMRKIIESTNFIENVKAGMRSSSAQEKMRKKVKCPHCDKEGKMGPMSRWHFDNCKMKGKHENKEN